MHTVFRTLGTHGGFSTLAFSSNFVPTKCQSETATGDVVCPSMHRYTLCRMSTGVPRRTFLNALLLSVFPIFSTNAVCGEPDPYFAHFLDWSEGLATTESGEQEVHYRLVGSEKKERKDKKFPILYLGDAGIGLTSGETLELLAGTNRRIVFADFLGVGQSKRRYIQEMSLQDIVRLACREVYSVMNSSGLGSAGQYHIIAAGFGIRVADALLQQQLPDSPSIASVAIEGWSPIPRPISFSQLQGNRICAEEGAEEGDIGIVEYIYGQNNTSTVQCIDRIANAVPTIAFSSKEGQSLEQQTRATNLKEVKASSGRLAHLSATQDFLAAMEAFLDKAEGQPGKD